MAEVKVPILDASGVVDPAFWPPELTDLEANVVAAVEAIFASDAPTLIATLAIAKALVDAKGDLLVATAADTVARLAVGANDTVLMADSTQATGVKWATPDDSGLDPFFLMGG